MLYGREAYDRHLNAINAIESLASAGVAGETYLERAEVHYADMAEMMEFFREPQQIDIMKTLGPVLMGQPVGGFKIRAIEAACESVRRKLKGKLMGTMSMLADGDAKKKMKGFHQRKNTAIEFKQRLGYIASIKA